MSKFDEYLAKKRAEQASSTPAEKPAPAANAPQAASADPSALQTVLGKFTQGVALGLGDELAGGLEAVGSKVGLRGVGGDFSEIRPETSDEDQKSFIDVYKEGRDKRRKDLDTAEKAHPELAKGAEIAGGITSGVVTGGAGNAGKAAIVGREALVGAAQGYGESDAGDLSTLAKDTVKGGVISGVMSAPGALFSGGSEALKALAERRAVKSLAPTLNQQELLARKGLDQKLGRELLDSGVVKFGSSVDDMAPRLDDMLSAKGSRIGEIRQAVDAAAPTGMNVGPIDRKADMMQALASVRNTGEQDLAGAYARNAKSLTGKPARSVADWQDEVSSISDQIPFHKPTSEFTPEQRALSELRKDIVGGVDDHIGKVRPDLVDEHTALKEQFAAFKEGDKILDKSVARQSRNRDFGLTDHLVGNISKGSGSAPDTARAAVMMYLNKLARERGNAALAKTADTMGDVLPDGIDKALLAAGRGIDTAAIDGAVTEGPQSKELPARRQALKEYLERKRAQQK